MGISIMSMHGRIGLGKGGGDISSYKEGEKNREMTRRKDLGKREKLRDS